MTVSTFTGTKSECEAELRKRGFTFNYDNPLEHERQYWRRGDGKPEVFLDHSATITRIGRQYAVSDFVHRRGIK